MASLTSTLMRRDSPLILGLKSFTVGTTLFLAGSMATVSFQLIPGLILATQQRNKLSSNTETGRLTPNPTSDSNKQLHLGPQAVLTGSVAPAALHADSGYKVAAIQFVLMSKTAFATQVPPELLTIIASGFLTYHYRAAKLPASIWAKWAAVAGLVTAIFPLTGGFMVPIDHKIARIAGEEAQVEPYEDAPPDREAERSNAEAFLRQWGLLNSVRAVVMVAAGGVGLWALLE
ncbi:hypothetical protein BAUCODRAFT_565213 [Baudoinia panamericana UAMH 10762]|uniref:DUF1772 domain-containing protein n=1 Tax=Baudoinia panamericana (strain UAMH 10762) TaxID=717646 RepID=M2MTK7_BAUPA|nr:uncharacterized protein BAUCODRAFT_565213 [Baudoinia panamericana UAMH 10762]EMC94868.1 hypothetical protein BAUCODRAFT_565213 [Baudoinia panamericana UAMH 10762]